MPFYSVKLILIAGANARRIKVVAGMGKGTDA